MEQRQLEHKRLAVEVEEVGELVAVWAPVLEQVVGWRSTDLHHFARPSPFHRKGHLHPGGSCPTMSAHLHNSAPPITLTVQLFSGTVV